MTPILTLLAHGVVGWALCGALIAVGRKITSLRKALVIHAVGAPVIFAGLTVLYRSFFDFATPLQTGLIFVGIVVFLDVFVVALFIEKSFEMFRSVIGTWVPFAGIFLATLVAGILVR